MKKPLFTFQWKAKGSRFWMYTIFAHNQKEAVERVSECNGVGLMRTSRMLSKLDMSVTQVLSAKS